MIICVRKNAPGKKAPQKRAPRKLPSRKIVLLNFVAFDIILRLFLYVVTSFRGASRTPATSIIDLLVTIANGMNECHKKLLFRCCGGCNLLGEVFQRYLSVRYIAQLVTHGKTVKIAKSVLCKISNFERPQSIAKF